MDNEYRNQQQIERLNQRGGRTLSIVDLIQAGTLTVEMAAYAMRAMANGASLLTGARPGGAGKTTLMAAILNFLPPDVPIATADSSRAIRAGLARPADPLCYLAHEIGSGDWFGYIWGQDVRDFFSLIRGSRRIASCLHADTLAELACMLCAPPLLVSPEALGQVGMILFIHVVRLANSCRRRVATFWEADGNGTHRLLYQWDAAADAFVRVGELQQPRLMQAYLDFVAAVVEQGEVETAVVRRKILDFYHRHQ